MLGRRLQAGAPVALVVLVRAGEERGEAAMPRELGEPVVELGLAEVAPVAPVRPIPGASELVRRDRLVTDADVCRDLACAFELPGRDARRHRGDGERLAAEGVMREGGDDRRVDATGERDHGGVERRDASDEVTRQLHAGTSCAAARARAHTVLTGSPRMRAARSQSACSGARLTILPSSFPTFTRTGSPPISTV